MKKRIKGGLAPVTLKFFKNQAQKESLCDRTRCTGVLKQDQGSLKSPISTSNVDFRSEQTKPTMNPASSKLSRSQTNQRSARNGLIKILD
jgi:hypothetical protein